MAEIFQRHLRPVAGEACRIRNCLLSRIRYRQGERCVLQYALRLVEPETRRERSQWVTGVLYPQDRTERIWQKLQRSDPAGEIPEAWRTFEPVSWIRELRMLVQVFPYDRRLSSLRLLMAGPPRHLEPTLLAGLAPGEWHAEEWSVVPIRYRPELGAVLRYTVRTRDRSTSRGRQT